MKEIETEIMIEIEMIEDMIEEDQEENHQEIHLVIKIEKMNMIIIIKNHLQSKIFYKK